MITGELRWKKKRNGIRGVGALAGSLDSWGYIQLCIDRKMYSSQRIVWKMVTGEDPELTIDHKDLNKTNNSWLNLREATRSQQMLNQKPIPRDLPKGVQRYRGVLGSLIAVIRKDGRQIRIGYFNDVGEAEAAYLAAAEEIYGEFRRNE